MADPALVIPEPTGQRLGPRREFLINVYGHLLAGIVAFIALEMVYSASGLAETIAGALLSVNWLLVLGAFIVVAWMARGFAGSAGSRPLQYAGLAGYVVAESIIFVPLLWVADAVAPGAIASAATLTILAFVGLTSLVFVSGADFSFLRGLLWGGGIVALVAMSAPCCWVGLGMWFSVAMIAFALAAILYDTSRALHDYPDDRYVSAAIELLSRSHCCSGTPSACSQVGEDQVRRFE